MKLRKRYWLIGFVALALLVIFVCVVFTGTEPRYHDRSLTYWLKSYDSLNSINADFKLRDQANEALKGMGVEAVPTLVSLLQAKDAPWKMKAAGLLAKLPVLHYTYWPAMSRNQAGRRGFQMLGTNAAAAVPKLIDILDQRVSTESETCVAWSLAYIGPAAKAAVPSLLRTLELKDSGLRDATIGALVSIHAQPELVLPAIVKQLDDKDEIFPSRVLWAVSAFGPEAMPALPGLLSRRNSTNEVVRGCVVLGVRKIHPATETAFLVLTNAIADTDAMVARDAVETLGDYGVDAKAAVPALTELLANTNQPVRDSAVFVLGKIHSLPGVAVPALIKALGDEDRDVRRHAADSLGAFGADAKPAVETLKKMANDPAEENYPRECAQIALKKIGAN